MSVYLPRVDEAVLGGLGTSLCGCVIVGVMVQCVVLFYIILYHFKVDHFPWYGSPLLFYSSIWWQGGARLMYEVMKKFKPVKTSGWQGGARVSCSSLGVGASAQLTTEESQALERPSSGRWKRMLFQNYRKLLLSFQLGLKIK